MKTKSPIRYILTLCFFAFLATIAASERPVFSQCDGVADSKIASDIVEKIKNDKSLAGQLRHINVSVTNKAVRFYGWTDSKKDYDRVVGFASGMTCVRMVNVNNFHEVPPAGNSPQRLGADGCQPGTKACGDICIPVAEHCNIP